LWKKIGSAPQRIGKQLVGGTANAAQALELQLQEKCRALVRFAVAHPFARGQSQRPAAAVVFQPAEHFQCLIFLERISHTANQVQLPGYRVTKAQIRLVDPVAAKTITQGQLPRIPTLPVETQTRN